MNFDLGAGSETSSDSDDMPELIPSRMADQRFTRYADNVVLTGSNNDVSDLFRHVWIDNILIATRNLPPFMQREDYLNKPGMLQTEIHFELFDRNSANCGGMSYRFLHLRVFVLVKKFLEGGVRIIGSKFLLITVSLLVLRICLRLILVSSNCQQSCVTTKLVD